jgi:dihydrofolate reductase
MLEIVYYVAASVDGYLAPPDGSLDWLSPFESSGEDYGFADFYESVDSVFVGSRTYEQALDFPQWPYAGKRTWVFSQRDLREADSMVTVTTGTPEQVAAEAASLRFRRAWLVGGGALAESFESAGLITEYIVSVLPVVLGAGIGLFGAAGGMETLELLDSRRFPDGVVQNRYRPSA